MPQLFSRPDLVLGAKSFKPSKIIWKSPSNIALIKYWGKFGNQFPRNPSVSFTLENAFTETSLEYAPKSEYKKGISVDFFFNSQLNKPFAERIEKYLQSLLPFFPFLTELDLTIFSSNSFPHSTGIASSASSMSALALCLCSMEDELFGSLSDNVEFEKKASFIARLGSGSACRSIYAQAALWGQNEKIENSNDEFAIPWADQLHPIFKTFHNDILIVNAEEKSVSSTAGHQLMENNPYSSVRYKEAISQLYAILSALRSGDLETFGTIIEQEAMSLHGLMMMSKPSFILVNAGTIKIIETIKKLRLSEKIPMYFTLDAGPNIHLMYPDEYKEKVREIIQTQLLKYCYNGSYILDMIGLGPKQI